MRVAIGQIKPKKAAYPENVDRIGDLFEQCLSLDPVPQVLVLPETALTGYFLEGGVRDVARSGAQVVADLQAAFRMRASREARMDVVAGYYDLCDGKYYNAALYATLSSSESTAESRLLHIHRKFFLPTYGVFDEKRFVSRGRTIDAFDTPHGRAAILICEDVWHSVTPAIVALKGAHLLYVVSASPGRDFGGNDGGNLARWQRILPEIAEEHGIFVIYAGLVGFEGGKGFTGCSCVVDPWGKPLCQGPATDECLLVCDIETEDVAVARAASPMLADLESVLPDIAIEFGALARLGRE